MHLNENLEDGKKKISEMNEILIVKQSENEILE